MSVAPVVPLSTLSIGSQNQYSWRQPVPILSSAPRTIPYKNLPIEAARFVEAVADFTETSSDLGTVIALGVLAACAQSRAVIEVKPGWREPLCVYGAAVSPSGSRKSAIVSLLAGPLKDAVARERVRLGERVAEAHAERAFLEARAKKLQTKYAGSRALDPCAVEEVLAADRAVRDVEIPPDGNLLCDDITPEALVRVMERNAGCGIFLSAEGEPLSIGRRYTGGEGARLNALLKPHAGEELVVHRVGRETVSIPEPRLSMALLVQPKVIEEFGGDASVRGLGFLARFALAWPEHTLGRRRNNARGLCSATQTAYADLINGTYRSPTGEYETITTPPEAYAKFAGLADWIEPELADGGRLAHCRDWAGKLTGLAARIAGIIHVAECEAGGSLDAQTAERGVELAVGFCEHELKVLDEIGAASSLSLARSVLQTIQRFARQGKWQISSRELQRACRPRPKASDLQSALNELVEGHWVRLHNIDSNQPHKVTVVELNPHAFSEPMDNVDNGTTEFAQ